MSDCLSTPPRDKRDVALTKAMNALLAIASAGPIVNENYRKMAQQVLADIATLIGEGEGQP